MSARRRAKVVPLPMPVAPGAMLQASPALIEEMCKRATVLEHGLYGLMAQATEGAAGLGEADFYPFWELSLEMVRDLRQAPRGARVMARYETRSGARTPRRRRVTSEILAPTTPCRPWPPEAFEHLGGNLEQIAGHLRGLVSALREFDPKINEAELGYEAAERQRWLYEALLDAVDHEQDRLQELAPLASYAARAREA